MEIADWLEHGNDGTRDGLHHCQSGGLLPAAEWYRS